MDGGHIEVTSGEQTQAMEKPEVESAIKTYELESYDESESVL